jgi:hypothetical protein
MQVEPANKDIRALQVRYKKEAAAANQRDAKMYKSIFEKLAKIPDAAAKAQSKLGAADDTQAPTTLEPAEQKEASGGMNTQQQQQPMNGHADMNGMPQAEPMVVDAQA